jgi:hypothetical protein
MKDCLIGEPGGRVRSGFRFSLARCPVLVCEHLDSTISLHYGPHRLGH